MLSIGDAVTVLEWENAAGKYVALSCEEVLVRGSRRVDRSREAKRSRGGNLLQRRSGSIADTHAQRSDPKRVHHRVPCEVVDASSATFRLT